MASVFLLNRTVVRIRKFPRFVKNLNDYELCAKFRINRSSHYLCFNYNPAKSPSYSSSDIQFRSNSVLKRVRVASMIFSSIFALN